MRNSLLLAGLACLASVASTPISGHAIDLDELLAQKGLIAQGETKGGNGNSPGAVYWNGATQFAFQNGFTANLKTMVQTRYTFDDEDESKSQGLFRNTSSFGVRRARIMLYGDAADGQFSYYLQPDFVGKETRSQFVPRGNADLNTVNTPQLQTAYITWHAADNLDLRMGQYKTLISRQYNTTDGYDQLPERSIASEFLFLGRQQGLTASTSLLDHKLGIWAGIYNGLSQNGLLAVDSNGGATFLPVSVEGENGTGLDTQMAGLFSVRYDALGTMNAYREGDFDQTEDLALNIGAAYAYNEGHLFAYSPTDFSFIAQKNTRTSLISVDASVKYQGFSLHSEIFTGDDKVEGAQDSFNPFGWYVQSGYFITPKEWEVVARYSYAKCDNFEDGQPLFSSICGGKLGGLFEKAQEVTAGVNYYFWNQNLKAQLAYSHFIEKIVSSGNADSNQIIFQMQFMG